MSNHLYFRYYADLIRKKEEIQSLLSSLGHQPSPNAVEHESEEEQIYENTAVLAHLLQQQQSAPPSAGQIPK